MPSEIPEPGDRAIVAWIAGGVPMRVYVRIDQDGEFASRWFNADEERGGHEGGQRWVELLVRFRNVGWSGPYPLNVGELLEGAS